MLGVQNTGDFETDHAKKVLEIYRRLSTAASLLPTAVGFTFDRETRTAQAQQDLRDLAPGLGDSTR